MMRRQLVLVVAIMVIALGHGACHGQMGGMREDPAVIQERIGVTNEEWVVIWTKLQKVMQWRAEVEATPADANTSRGGNMMMFGGRGGSSLEGATQAGRGGMPFGGAPFSAPPSTTNGGMSGMMGVIMGMMGTPGGAGGNMFATTQANAMQSLLAELQTLLSDPNATDDQIREKLVAIHATRDQARAALKDAEASIARLLTEKQIALLMLSGYLD
jgi:hypothetical protein